MKRFAAMLLVIVGISVGVSAQNQLTGAQTQLAGVRFVEGTTPITVKFENAALGKVLHALSTSVGVTILIDSAVDTTQSVNLTLRNAAPADVLNAVIDAANAKVTVVSPSTILLQPR
jgi:hypothetical protein